MQAMSKNVETLLDELQAAHIVRPLVEPEPTWLFNHVLVQETAYNSILVKTRREYHRMIASAIEREYPNRSDDYCAALVYHLWRGEDWPQAARFARRAGERALRVYGLREALGYFTQALSALDRMPEPPPDQIVDVILGWAEAAFGFEPYPRQLEVLERAERLARDLGDARRLALVLHTTGRVHIAAGHAVSAAPALIECFELATALGDERLAIMPTHYMGMATFDADPRAAIAWFDRAIELARRYDEIDVQAYALSARAMIKARLGEPDTRDDVERALALTPQVKSPMCDSDVHLFAAFALQDMGDVTGGLEYAKRSVEKATSADNVECACVAYACLGFGHLRAAQTDAAAGAFHEALRRSKISGAELSEVMGERGLGLIQSSAGNPLGLQELERALAHAKSVGLQHETAVLSQTLAEAYAARGQVEQARAFLQEALAYFQKHQMRPYLERALELETQINTATAA